jgi:DNA ligase-1
VKSTAQKPFRPLLAASEIPTIEQIRLPQMASFKYDGIRATIHDEGVMSRTMIRIPNRSVQRHFLLAEGRYKYLDGELVVGPPTGQDVMQRTTSGINSQDGLPDFTFYVFEVFGHTGTAIQRYEFLKNLLPILTRGDKRIQLVNQEMVFTRQRLKEKYKEALDLGYEGLILKKPTGLYKNGRSTLNEGLALKWKEFADSECEILLVKQATTNKNEDVRSATGYAKRSTAKAGKVLVQSVGGFKVRDIHTGVEFSCAPGVLTKDYLEALWEVRDQLVGKVFTYKYQVSGVKDKPRYPGFKAWRAGFDIEINCEG